jgi:hypothetical protein
LCIFDPAYDLFELVDNSTTATRLSSPAMPFVDIHSKLDYAAIFYTTNTPFRNVSSFDPEKPSVVILHPAFLDLSWVDLQLGDSRLDSNYNIIAFDSRSSGRSTCRLSGRHDNWVDAADLAFCFHVGFQDALSY